MHEPAARNDGVECAARHALGWLVFGNSVGLFLSILLVRPQWQPELWTYGHWVPIHLNVQLYGWTALPLVAWLLKIYEVDASKVPGWGSAAVWGWTAALIAGCFQWLAGVTSGKIFLDWRNASLWCFIAALLVLWIVLSISWWQHALSWSLARRRGSVAGLAALGVVPVMMVIAASPKTYPPIDPTTGGPTGSSLLGSTLIVIGLMLLLPRVSGMAGRGKARWGTWLFFGLSWLVFAVTEAIGGGHFDSWQIGAMLLLLPWAWLIRRDWLGFDWPPHSSAWRTAMIFWWTLLVFSAVAMYAPGVLDRIKFTQGLVAHSHLAMAGFTTSFCAVLLSTLTQRPIGGRASVMVWNAAAFAMIAVLAAMGWREGQSAEWMIIPEHWREAGLIARAIAGVFLLGSSIGWFLQFLRP